MVAFSVPLYSHDPPNGNPTIHRTEIPQSAERKSHNPPNGNPTIHRIELEKSLFMWYVKVEKIKENRGMRT